MNTLKINRNRTFFAHYGFLTEIFWGAAAPPRPPVPQAATALQKDVIDIFLVFLLLTLNIFHTLEHFSSNSIVDFEQLLASKVILKIAVLQCSLVRLLSKSTENTTCNF